MDLVNDLFSNQWLICAFIAWLIAQLIKGTLEWVKNKKFDLSRYLGAGGMPSSHSGIYGNHCWFDKRSEYGRICLSAYGGVCGNL